MTYSSSCVRVLCQPPAPWGRSSWDSTRAAGTSLVIREVRGLAKAALLEAEPAWKLLAGVGCSYTCMYTCSLGWSLAARSQNNSCWKGPLEVSSLVPFSKQHQEERVTQGFSSWVLKGPRPSVSPPLWWKSVSMCLIRISHVLACIHSFLLLPGHLWGESGTSFPESSHEVVVGSGLTPRAFPWPYILHNLGDCRYLKVEYSNFFHVFFFAIKSLRKTQR